jgi:hypothetical protein
MTGAHHAGIAEAVTVPPVALTRIRDFTGPEDLVVHQGLTDIGQMGGARWARRKERTA